MADLMVAASEGDVEWVKWLLEGSSLNEGLAASMVEGETILHTAARSNRMAVVKFIAEKCSDEQWLSIVNLKDKFGCTPLHYAVSKNYEELVVFLCTHLADVNITDNDGNGALHLAAIGAKNESVISVLLMTGDFDERNRFGVAASDYAVVRRNARVKEVLDKRRADAEEIERARQLKAKKEEDKLDEFTKEVNAAGLALKERLDELEHARKNPPVLSLDETIAKDAYLDQFFSYAPQGPPYVPPKLKKPKKSKKTDQAGASTSRGSRPAPKAAGKAKGKSPAGAGPQVRAK